MIAITPGRFLIYHSVSSNDRPQTFEAGSETEPLGIRTRGNPERKLAMLVTITIPTALRQFTDGNTSIKVEASTAGEALDHLATAHPELRRHSMMKKTVCEAS